jgi:hypothetical protein
MHARAVRRSDTASRCAWARRASVRATSRVEVGAANTTPAVADRGRGEVEERDRMSLRLDVRESSSFGVPAGGVSFWEEDVLDVERFVSTSMRSINGAISSSINNATFSYSVFNTAIKSDIASGEPSFDFLIHFFSAFQSGR